MAAGDHRFEAIPYRLEDIDGGRIPSLRFNPDARVDDVEAHKAKFFIASLG
jgi:hypothetical protein